MTPGTERVGRVTLPSARPESGQKARVPALLRSPFFWVLVFVFAAEFFLFDRFGSRRHTSVYPRWNDQIQYLSEGYTAHERARTGNFGAALEHTLINRSAQGTLHDAAALIAFKLAGASRSTALALNMLALIAWQAALFIAVLRRSGSAPVALAAAMLPAALAGPWENIPGAAYDFRLDHFAMCALGVTSTCAWLADGFRSARGSTAFGIAVALTVLTRFLTGTYFVVIFAALLAWICTRPDRKMRLTNYARAALFAAVLAGPFLWHNREAVLDYYWVGHYVGPESTIRDPHLGLGASLSFVFGNLMRNHLGVFVGGLAAVGLLAFALGAGKRATTDRAAVVVGMIFLLAPALVLTLHRQKSEVVLSALAPGAVLLIVTAWVALRREGAIRRVALTAAGIVIAVGVFFTQRQLRPAYDAATLAHIRQVNTIADALFARVQAGRIADPRVAVDYITDCLDAQVLRVVCYERKRVWLPLDMTLPTGIAEPADTDVMARLQNSHFVFLTEEAADGPFPYDRKLAAMRAQLTAWCQANLRATERFNLLGRRMVLYQRPEIPFAAPRP